jgi:predicted PurR-regulated permease PerM
VGLLGLPHPLLWGVAAFLLHYIPFVGATGGIVAMTLVSMIHFDSVWYALLPPLAYVFCAMIEGNLATPLFLGRWLTLNPIAILLTFLLWSYLWGGLISWASRYKVGRTAPFLKWSEVGFSWVPHIIRLTR